MSVELVENLDQEIERTSAYLDRLNEARRILDMDQAVRLDSQLTEKEVRERVLELLQDEAPDNVGLRMIEISNDLGIPYNPVRRAIMELEESGVIKNVTPDKRKNKRFAFIGQAPSREPTPAPAEPAPKAKKAKPAKKPKIRKRGESIAITRKFLEENREVTAHSLAEAHGVSWKHGSSLMSEARKHKLVARQPHRTIPSEKGGRPVAVSLSLVYKQPAPKRESVIRPGEGVFAGRRLPG